MSPNPNPNPDPTHPAERHLALLGRDLDRLEGAVLRRYKARYRAGRPGGWADDLITWANGVYRLSAAHARGELALRHRAYAAGEEDEESFELADYYKDYLVDLVGVANEDLARRVGETLEAGERGEMAQDPQGNPQALGVNDLAEALGQVLNRFLSWRLRTIVRTEGTRVASAARRDIGIRAQEGRYGPDWLVYSAVLDDRVTRTCRFAHGRKRPFDPGHPLWLEVPPPNHYSCRSLERYGYAWDAEDAARPDWDEQAVEAFRGIRAEEFPHWTPQPLPPRRV